MAVSPKKKDKKEDRRTRYTRKIIKDTFLELLHKKAFSKISVTEICKIADLNRGTFYLHYYDMDDVLDDVIDEMLSGTSSMIDHVMCPEKTGCSYPFCEKVQNNDEYQILFFDEHASSRILERLIEMCKETFTSHLMRNSLLTLEQAEAVLQFQMTGCLTINRMMLKNKCTDWRSIQKTIDRFIRAGLEEFLIHDQRNEGKDVAAEMMGHCKLAN